MCVCVCCARTVYVHCVLCSGPKRDTNSSRSGATCNAFPLLSLVLSSPNRSQATGDSAPFTPQVPRGTPHTVAVQVDQYGGHVAPGQRAVEEGGRMSQVGMERMQAELTQTRTVSAVGWTKTWGACMIFHRVRSDSGCSCPETGLLRSG